MTPSPHRHTESPVWLRAFSPCAHTWPEHKSASLSGQMMGRQMQFCECYVFSLKMCFGILSISKQHRDLILAACLLFYPHTHTVGVEVAKAHVSTHVPLLTGPGGGDQDVGTHMLAWFSVGHVVMPSAPIEAHPALHTATVS